VTHLAYELHVSNVYKDTGTLILRRVSVYADHDAKPLVRVVGPQVNDLLAHPADVARDGVPIEGGQRVVLFLWLDLPAGGKPPKMLRHQLDFQPGAGPEQRVDGVLTAVDTTPPIVIGPPLGEGRWLVHEGPGNHLSHHWGSLVAANGRVTIPQRYAIDFFGLDGAGHAVRADLDKLTESTNADWAGFGAPVLAVADGVVRDARDGKPDNRPMTSPPSPSELTTRSLMGNFVVLEIAPRVFVSYAHLQPGSLTVKAGDRVKRGAVIGRLGQSGAANARPHPNPAGVEPRHLSADGRKPRVWVLIGDDDSADCILATAQGLGAELLWRDHYWAEFNGYNHAFRDPWGNEIVLWGKAGANPEIPAAFTRE
jgi:murein DD-endopeptidase MepM/ murein hydrolase activator NlpD